MRCRSARRRSVGDDAGKIRCSHSVRNRTHNYSATKNLRLSFLYPLKSPLLEQKLIKGRRRRKGAQAQSHQHPTAFGARLVRIAVRLIDDLGVDFVAQLSIGNSLLNDVVADGDFLGSAHGRIAHETHNLFGKLLSKM